MRVRGAQDVSEWPKMNRENVQTNADTGRGVALSNGDFVAQSGAVLGLIGLAFGKPLAGILLVLNLSLCMPAASMLAEEGWK